MRRNLQRLMVAIAAMMICLGASATDKLTRSLDHENALTSLEDLQLATFALQTGDVVLYTPKDWDIKVASFETAISNGDNGVFYKLDAVDAHFRMELYNFNQKRRTYWGSNLAYVNSQPAGQTVIFGLSGASPKFGQDGQDLALWDITYEAGKGFAFKCVGRTDGSIYIGHDGTAARAVSDITYWQAYPLAYKASEVEAAATEVLAAIKLSDSKKAIEDAQAAYASKNSFANLTKYGDAVNAAIDAIAAAEAINKTYASFEVAKAVADQYAAGNVKNVSELGSLYREAVKSQKFAGADMTGAIENFDCAAKDGWTFDKPKGGNGPDHGGDFEYWAGNASDRATASFDYWQEITGLPNGTYTVSAEMYNSLNGEGGDYTEFKPTCGVYATVGEKTVSKLVDTNSETRVPYETEAIEVTDGKIRIGVKSFEAPMAARWFTVDNFKLTLVEPAKAPAPAEEKWFTDNVFCYKDAANNVSRSMELPWVADPDNAENGCIALSSAANAANDHDLQFMIRGAEYDGADLTKGAFAEGTGFKVSFKVKADGNYTGCLVGAFNSIVASGKDGWKHSYYLGNQSVKMDVTTEWQTVSYSVLATADDAGKLTAIGFNLAEKGGAARTFYFDDVKVTYESGIEEWTEAIKFGVKVTPFTQDPADETKWVAGDDVVNDPAYKVVDGDGMFEVVVDGKKANAWDTQFFFQIADAAPSKALKMNDKVTLKYKIKAVSETLEEGTELSLGGNLHTACGSGWFAGAPAGKAVIGKWTDIEQLFEIGDPKTTNYSMNMSADANPITYYIDEVSVKFEAAPVLDWVELIPNGDCETAAEHAFAAAKEVPVDGSNVNKARIVDGVGKDGGKGIEVVAGAKESQPWDNQFWIYEPYYLPAGTSIIVEFDYKADLAGSVGTQSHREPAAGNNYLHYIGIGNVSFTTEWQHFKYEGKIQNECDGKDDDGNAVARFLSFAFNLNDIADANKYYFDNLSFKVPADVISGKEPIYDVDTYKEVEYKDPATLDWSENILENGDLKSNDMREFVLKNNDVEDPEMLPAEKSAIGDGFEIGIETAARPTKEDGSVGGNDYDAQFFVRLPYVLPKNTKFNLEFDLYAEEVNTLAIQAHGEPGQYKANLGSVKTDTSGEGIVHYQKYLSAPEDMRSIAFNLAVETKATYGFSNIKVQIVNDDKAAIEEATATADATTLWAETLALNIAANKGRNTETEGKNYTEESVKALEDAIAAGKAELKKDAAEVTAESLTAATKAIEDAIAGLFLDKPELDADFIEIAQVQPTNFSTAATASGEYNGDAYTTYTSPADINVAFKMTDVDVTGCDKIYVYFAQPLKAGWNIAFWGIEGPAGVKAVAADTEFIEFDLTEKLGDTEATYEQDGKTILKEVTLIDLWGATHPLEAKVYGVYKHKAAPALAYTDLTKEMFFVWSDWTDADATAQAGCAYEVGTSSDMPYGDGSVINYADLSEYATLEVTTTEGAPRFLFNRDVKDGQWNENEADSHLIDNTKGGWSAKYFTSKDNGDGSTTYIVDIAALVADKGYAHLHSIKGANWAKTTVTDMKLGYVGEKPALPTIVPVAINGIAEGASVKDGKYFINGQIVIVKNGVKYNAAGVAIK